MSQQSSHYVLEQLFGPGAKLRLLRLFLRNPEELFTISDIAEKLQYSQQEIKKEIANFLSINLIGAKLVMKKDKEEDKASGRVEVFYANPNFDFYDELQSLVLKSSPASKEKMVEGLKRIGKVKLAVVSGIFVNYEPSRVDLLVVADGAGEDKLKKFLRNLESETGTDIRFALMDTDEFRYRQNMFDRFLRDIFDYPHEKLINKLKV